MGEDLPVLAESKEWLEIQTKEELTLPQINNQLMVLQTAFPTVVRGYDQYEFAAMQELWYAIFKNCPEDLLQAGIQYFIIHDRRGFFPSPGQIIGAIEKVIQERKNQDLLQRIMAKYRT